MSVRGSLRGFSAWRGCDGAGAADGRGETQGQGTEPTLGLRDTPKGDLDLRVSGDSGKAATRVS